jgi:hypothetical protein
MKCSHLFVVDCMDQILDADTVDTCARCKSRRALQAKYLADIGDLYEVSSNR